MSECPSCAGTFILVMYIELDSSGMANGPRFLNLHEVIVM
jgi:hypothetical protein